MVDRFWQTWDPFQVVEGQTVENLVLKDGSAENTHILDICLSPAFSFKKTFDRRDLLLPGSVKLSRFRIQTIL